MMLTIVTMIVLKMVMMMVMMMVMVMTMVLMIVMKVLTSTLHISHKQLIVASQRKANNMHVVCNKDDDIDDDVYDSVCNGDDEDDNDVADDGYDGDGVDDSVDNSDDGDDKHLPHLTQAADCCLIERSKQNKHVVCNKDNDVYNGVDNDDNDSIEEEDDCVDDGNDSKDKHFTHLSHAADCFLMERNKQNKHVVCNKDNDFDYCDDDSVGNGDDDGDDDGDDNGVDDGDEGADKHHTHLLQAAD
eukprot:2177283-Ditylum_brightwellii.AAC.1